MFSGKELYIVTGSDVITNASAYKAKPQPFSIHSMNHLIFIRPGFEPNEGPDCSLIKGQVQFFELTSELEDVSSTRIRNNIDLNRDISNLIAPMAQNFIYEQGLYMREPQYKKYIDQIIKKQR